MAKSALSDIIGGAIVILALFGIIYMLSDVLMGITLIFICGVLIFVRAFVEKAGM